MDNAQTRSNPNFHSTRQSSNYSSVIAEFARGFRFEIIPTALFLTPLRVPLDEGVPQLAWCVQGTTEDFLSPERRRPPFELSHEPDKALPQLRLQYRSSFLRILVFVGTSRKKNFHRGVREGPPADSLADVAVQDQR
jgi:hypothetical protein